MTDPRRALPSVNALLELPELRQLLGSHPRDLVVNAVRSVLDDVRAGASAPASGDAAEWARRIAAAVALAERPSLRPVLNATGVVLHTNLGRAPLPEAALAAMRRAAEGYSNLEYDLGTGARGSRYVHCVGLLRELTGAEDAIVVNNGAAAVTLALNTLADGREAVLSRGELVEIGGSFRVPEIMAKSGARLVEVGTTNRTHPADYAGAITPRTGAIVKVHRSNFSIDGFVADVDVAELVKLAAPHGVPVLHDLGSGLMIPLDRIGLTGEPTVRDAVRAGATLVAMSGDKLLGGPQAGLLVGSAEAIAAVRQNPLTRAFRVDKLTLAALEATLAIYREPDRAFAEIPALRMLGASVESIAGRAEAIRAALPAHADARVVRTDATVGGGAFPLAKIPSAAVSL
ncbi:MAG TPA: L-seryl-tRNA(Sec) selenium transferase, partial [Gemmatimonadaceae bacterium]|nr:L-seryl-tRNA(Sec) selenium transferase [Gemmatimonadaceae bacterium]